MKRRTGYLIKRGHVYHAVWTVSGKKFMVTTGKRNKDDAQTELARIMQPFVVGDQIKVLEHVKGELEGRKGELARLEDERNPPLRVVDAWVRFTDANNRPDSGPVTLRGYESHFSQFENWLEGQHPNLKTLRDVSKAIAGEYATHLTKRGLSANRFNKHIRLLELLFRVLKDAARTNGEPNPWTDIQRKRQIAEGRRELTVEELRTVCEAATGELRTLLAIGIYTGLRLGDCSTLRWGEVDLVRNLIKRIPRKTGRRNPKPVMIPIHPTLKAILSEVREAQQAGQAYVLPDTAALYGCSPERLTNGIREHFEKCGIQVHKPGTGFESVQGEDGKQHEEHTGKRAVVEVGFHSLRHTFVSLCRQSGAPLAVVEAVVGHSNPAMTRHYTHVSELAAGQAVGLLPSVLGKDMPATTVLKMIEAHKVRELAERLTSKTANEIRAELLKLTEPDKAK
jgi:integrase